jgi:translation elongation factor EF-Tu-like GTPase
VYKLYDFEAEVTLLSTEAGGRQDSLKSGCRPRHALSENWVTTGEHDFIGVSEIKPGETVKANIRILSPLANSLWVGREILIKESLKTIGHAKITKIYNEIFLKDS